MYFFKGQLYIDERCNTQGVSLTELEHLEVDILKSSLFFLQILPFCTFSD